MVGFGKAPIAEQGTMRGNQHRQRHIELHDALDELAADWLSQQPEGTTFWNATIADLLQWSREQARTAQPLHGNVGKGPSIALIQRMLGDWARRPSGA
jgi:hypothetical protein